MQLQQRRWRRPPLAAPAPARRRDRWARHWPSRTDARRERTRAQMRGHERSRAQAREHVGGTPQRASATAGARPVRRVARSWCAAALHVHFGPERELNEISAIFRSRALHIQLRGGQHAYTLGRTRRHCGRACGTWGQHLLQPPPCIIICVCAPSPPLLCPNEPRMRPCPRG